MKVAILARLMFETYNNTQPNPWTTYDGRAVPSWPDLTDQVRAKWVAAAKRAHAEVIRSVRAELEGADFGLED